MPEILLVVIVQRGSAVALGSLFLHRHLLAEALGCVTNEFTALLMQRRVTTANKRICANEFRFEIICRYNILIKLENTVGG
jgi:hypothetical protein